MDLSYCVVNTNGRELLLACLAAIREHAPAELESEILVVDNASDDGSADAVAAWGPASRSLGGPLRLLRRERREGKAALDSLLLREARGELCLLLNEDSELRAGAVEALVEALRADPQRGRRRRAARSTRRAGRSRAPGACPARRPRSRARSSCTGGWSPRAAASGRAGGRLGAVGGDARPPPRRRAASATSTPPSSSTPTRPTSPSACTTPAGAILYVPDAVAVHHEQLATDVAARERRVVEFHRGRDRYLRKHHGAAVALALRPLLAPALRAAGAGGRGAPRPRPAAVRAARAPGAAARAAARACARPRRPTTRRGRGGPEPGRGRGRATPVARCRTASRSLLGKVNT